MHRHGAARRYGLWNPCCRCGFSPIPDDLMIHSFCVFLTQRDLARAAATCRRWRFLSMQPSLWTRIDVRELGVCEDEHVAQVLASHGTSVQELVVQPHVQLSDRTLGSFRAPP